MGIKFFFDSEKKLEYFQHKGKFVGYPIGQSLLDFTEADFVEHDSSNPDIIDNPFLKKYPSYDDYRNDMPNILDALKKLRPAILFVLSDEIQEYKDLSAIQRAYLYQEYYRESIIGLPLNVQHIFVPKSEFVRPISVETSISKSEVLKKAAEFIHNVKINIVEVYEVNEILSGGYLVLLKMIMNGIKVKKCRYCHKYFVPSGRIDTMYCNRIAPNSKKTCSEIGAIQNYKNEIKNNPLMIEFQRMYKKLNARVKAAPNAQAKKAKQKQFFEWSEKARNLRERAITENMSLEEFKKELNKLEVEYYDR